MVKGDFVTQFEPVDFGRSRRRRKKENRPSISRRGPGPVWPSQVEDGSRLWNRSIEDFDKDSLYVTSSVSLNSRFGDSVDVILVKGIWKSPSLDACGSSSRRFCGTEWQTSALCSLSLGPNSEDGQDGTRCTVRMHHERLWWTTQGMWAMDFACALYMLVRLVRAS